MERFKAGQRDAFIYIHNQFARELIFFTEKIVGPREEAEGIVADSFYKLFHARTELDTLERVKNWLYVTVRNHCIDYIERPDAIETQGVRAMLLGSILRVIEKLPGIQRTVMEMFLDRKTARDIAEALGIDSQAVVGHKDRALETIRRSYPNFHLD